MGMADQIARRIGIGALVGAVALAPLMVVAVEPSTRPADALKVVELSVLLSPDPKAYGPAEDVAITKLIERHNANQDRLAEVTLRGQCVWNLEGNPGRPRQMRLHYSRSGASATLQCGQDSCTVRGSRVTASADSLIHTDALYLLMFRKYNPKGFRAAPAGRVGDKPVIVAKSDSESLEFDAQSGQLVRAIVQTTAGPVAANFEDFAATGSGNDKAILPTRVWLSVPDGFFPEGWATNAKITLTIDAALSTVRGSGP